MCTAQHVAASICLVWYGIVVTVSAIGHIQLRRYYSAPPKPAMCLRELPPSELPHVTIIRPIVGIEPKLYQCLASTLRQTYPTHKLSVAFCIASHADPALPILERLLRDFPHLDAKIYIETEDPRLWRGAEKIGQLGPNPKIWNISRAYREAKGDLIWIVDCNVWLGKGVAGRMVDTLCGYGGNSPHKFVHQLPLAIDLPPSAAIEQMNIAGSPWTAESATENSHLLDDTTDHMSSLKNVLDLGGGRLEELFMSSSHCKFYTAINTVLIAPCIIGKSSMFRRSHLDWLTKRQPMPIEGIDFFSHNIDEDHQIGDILWKNKVPEETVGQTMGKHAMVFGDLAIQPMVGMAVRDYVARRGRWLRVRKYTVKLATFVEHGTECFAASLYGAYAFTSLPWFADVLHFPQTWSAFGIFWICNVLLWVLVDWTQYILLHSAASIEVDDDTPDFVRPPPLDQKTRRHFQVWLAAWIGREMLAFPIWVWAVFGGATVTWRGKKFWVGVDMRAHEIGSTDRGNPKKSTLIESPGRSSSKDRQD